MSCDEKHGNEMNRINLKGLFAIKKESMPGRPTFVTEYNIKLRTKITNIKC
jgi:hypothetical protein